VDNQCNLEEEGFVLQANTTEQADRETRSVN
jgi:hypothetical protein